MASQLRGLIRHRYELMRESTRRKNRLTAICDQLFPEFTQLFKDPNGATALAVRAAFATPHSVATASSAALCALRVGTLPSNAKLALLQELATTSIGLKDLARQRSLAFEQEQLIAELRLIQDHLAKLDVEIERIIAQSREGRILTSTHVVGPIQAATIISAIGSIENFPSAGHLKSYCGWAPKREQTGVTMDRTSLTRAGTRTMKYMMYLMVGNAIQMDCEWARIYERLVPITCAYDERKRDYVGKNKVVGRMAGQISRLIYMLLKTDAEVLAKTPPDTAPPKPMLYDPAVHRAHRDGGYRTARPRRAPARVIRLPRRTTEPSA